MALAASESREGLRRLLASPFAAEFVAVARGVLLPALRAERVELSKMIELLEGPKGGRDA